MEATASRAESSEVLFTGQPVFPLKGSDISAPLTIKFWVKVQQRIRKHMDAGMTLEEAVKEAEIFYFLEDVAVDRDDAKLTGAVLIAREMEQVPARKLAD